jgi:DNA end-binding protein Ku
MTEAPEGGAQVIDLMEALRASLEKKPEPRKPPKRAAQPAPAVRKTAKKQ